MLLNFIKLLIEAPGKLLHALIKCLRYFFALLLSLWLFHLFLGKYWPTIPKPNIDWIAFCKGPFLFYVFFYLVSYFILFELLRALFFGILHFITRTRPKKPQDERKLGDAIKRFLNFFDLIKTNKETGKPQAGKNTRQLFEVIKALTDDAEETESPIDHSFINDGFFFYALFAGCYIFMPQIPAHPIGMSFLIAIGFLFLFCLYIGIYKLFEFLQEHGEKILRIVEALLLEQTIEKAFAEIQIHVQRKTVEGASREKFIKYNGGEYEVRLYYSQYPITARPLTRYFNEINRNKSKMILFINNQLTPEALEKCRELKESLFIFPFTKEEEIAPLVATSFPLGHSFGLPL